MYLLHIPQILFQESRTYSNYWEYWLLTVETHSWSLSGNHPWESSHCRNTQPLQCQCLQNKGRAFSEINLKGPSQPESPHGLSFPLCQSCPPHSLKQRREHTPESSSKITKVQDLGFISKSIWLSALSSHQLKEDLDFDVQNTNPYIWARHTKSLSPPFLMATPPAYRCSQARGPIEAAAAGPHHSYSNAGYKSCLWLTP